MGNFVKSCRPDDEDAKEPSPERLNSTMHWSVVPETLVRTFALVYISLTVVALAILGTIYALSLERNVRILTDPLFQSYNPATIGHGINPNAPKQQL